MALLPPSATIGSENVILRARARRHTVTDFPGPLSIKSVVEGKVSWKTGGREIAVDECSFLVLNNGEPYSMNIDSATPVTTCCAFFEPAFVESIRSSLCATQLDEVVGRTPEFRLRLHPGDNRILPRMRAIHRAQTNQISALWVEQQFTLLARDLLLLHDEILRQVRRLPAVRMSTREEVFRRLSRGREFMHANLDRNLTLGQIARAACLSAYHFHRLFRQAFAQSPHDYLTGIRLERAKYLLARDERPLIEVCAEAGFASVGSFGLLFRRKLGVTPGAFRRSAK